MKCISESKFQHHMMIKQVKQMFAETGMQNSSITNASILLAICACMHHPSIAMLLWAHEMEFLLMSSLSVQSFIMPSLKVAAHRDGRQRGSSLEFGTEPMFQNRWRNSSYCLSVGLWQLFLTQVLFHLSQRKHILLSSPWWQGSMLWSELSLVASWFLQSTSFLRVDSSGCHWGGTEEIIMINHWVWRGWWIRIEMSSKCSYFFVVPFPIPRSGRKRKLVRNMPGIM